LLSAETVAASGGPAAQRSSYDYDSQGVRQGQDRDGGYRVYAIDANGSTVGLEAANGVIAASDRYDYDPYGELDRQPSGTDSDDLEGGLSEAAKGNPFRFEGFYYDAGVKTYDMRARQYRPEIGRFLSRDTYASAAGEQALQADPLTQNRYAFAGGNPVSNVEFDGHLPKEYIDNASLSQNPSKPRKTQRVGGMILTAPAHGGDKQPQGGPTPAHQQAPPDAGPEGQPAFRPCVDDMACNLLLESAKNAGRSIKRYAECTFLMQDCSMQEQAQAGVDFFLTVATLIGGPEAWGAKLVGGRVFAGVATKAGDDALPILAGGAEVATKSQRIKQAMLPSRGRIRYVPPKRWNPHDPLPQGPGGGYLDRFGNEWVRGPSRTAGESFEWDVQLSETGRNQIGWLSRNGTHVNVNRGGQVTHR
ncbi:MAG: polymorphic toxin type 17 domain-containing protein, partial [Acidimicrobiales bacterium]|nr:polymorphic toxin type 17 domain-containing protein [Acidimicrobiales bacterium]